MVARGIDGTIVPELEYGKMDYGAYDTYQRIALGVFGLEMGLGSFGFIGLSQMESWFETFFGTSWI